MSADHARAPTAKDVRDGRDSDSPAPLGCSCGCDRFFYGCGSWSILRGNADERKLTIHLDEARHRLTVLMQSKMT